MNKILLRILLGLVAVITALGLFSLTVVTMSNDVRLEHYWSDIVRPPLNYIGVHSIELLDSAPSSISIVPNSLKGASTSTKARLASNQVVVSLSEQQMTAWHRSGNHVIMVESDLQGDAIYEIYRWLITSHLNRLDSVLSPESSSTEIENLSNSLNVEISKVTETQKLTSQRLLNELADHGLYTGLSEGSMHSFIQLKGGEIYEINFPDSYVPYSWWIILFLLFFSSSVLGGIAFILIQNFDRRIRNIETAASRISRGELDARVSRAGDEDAISRLGTAFNSMADHIQRLMYVQKEMIHAVSHELRTPVARIRFGVQMIEDCHSEDELLKQVRGIDGDIQELDELIDEILTYARLEQGGPILAFQEADVEAIVEQVVSEQGSVKPEMHIFSEYKKGSHAWKMSEIEARYIHRSIQNLVGNATRYAKGKVKVSCSFDSETCRVDVEDDGSGIPEQDWESVFTPFARLDDSRTRSSGGYGLGLSIVRRILYWHGGQAFLGRSDMGGAKFSLVWPRKQTKS